MSPIRIRPARPEDARGILEAHYSAVHETAGKDYPKEILEAWSRPVDEDRIAKYLAKDFPGEVTIVAEVEGAIAGFGVIVPEKQRLGAVYVAKTFGGRGVGEALLNELERMAKEAGCAELAMDSSVTAKKFYLRHGYKITQLGMHTLRGGREMECVRMRKILDPKPEGRPPEGAKVKVVTCAIIRHEGKVLLARRLPDDAQGGLWEFPGGKVDPGETEEQCLARELDEELGMRVRIERLLMRHRYEHSRGVLELVAFLCDMVTAPTRLEAHSEVVWVEPDEVLDWDLMAADVGVGEVIRL